MREALVSYLKKHAGLLFLSLVTNWVAIGVWEVYLFEDYVYFSKFGAKFYGDAALFQSLSILGAALLCDYYLAKSVHLHLHLHLHLKR